MRSAQTQEPPPTAGQPLSRPKRSLRHGALAVARWFDNAAGEGAVPEDFEARRVDWLRVIPFIAMHLACLGVFWVGWSWTAVGIAAALYAVRMFAITGFYHRYFSHRTFRTSRAGQFAFALLGNTCVQRGPLWWAAHHRNHHQYSDRKEDEHSPVKYGFLWSHVGWFLSKRNFATHEERVGDLARYPELRFLNRFDIIVPAILAAGLFYLGVALERHAPSLGTNGPQLLIWGFFVSTILLLHACFMINSVAHKIGVKRYDTGDESRNSLLLALLTFGEGWHNNHHHYPASVRQGHYWWEIDITHYLLVALSWTGLIWDLKPVPASARESGLREARPAA